MSFSSSSSSSIGPAIRIDVPKHGCARRTIHPYFEASGEKRRFENEDEVDDENDTRTLRDRSDLLGLFKKLSPDQHSADLRCTGPDLISLSVA